MLAGGDVTPTRPLSSPIYHSSSSTSPSDPQTHSRATLNVDDYMLPAANKPQNIDQSEARTENVNKQNASASDKEWSNEDDQPLPENISVQQFLAQLEAQEETGSESESGKRNSRNVDAKNRLPSEVESGENAAKDEEGEECSRKDEEDVSSKNDDDGFDQQVRPILAMSVLQTQNKFIHHQIFLILTSLLIV